MLKRIFANYYVIGGLVSFFILFALGLYLEFSLEEAFVLAVIGTATAWWQRQIWY